MTESCAATSPMKQVVERDYELFAGLDAESEWRRDWPTMPALLAAAKSEWHAVDRPCAAMFGTAVTEAAFAPSKMPFLPPSMSRHHSFECAHDGRGGRDADLDAELHNGCVAQRLAE